MSRDVELVCSTALTQKPDLDPMAEHEDLTVGDNMHSSDTDNDKHTRNGQQQHAQQHCTEALTRPRRNP